MLKRLCLSGIIILILISCNRKSVQVHEKELYRGIWTEKFVSLSGSGDIHLITPEKSLNAIFDFSYNRTQRKLTGSIYGFLGVKVADFTIGPGKVDVKTIIGGKTNIDSILSQAGIPAEFFVKCFGYDFSPEIVKQVGIKVDDGYLVSTPEYDVLLGLETGLPVKVATLKGGRDLQVVYKDFRTVSGYKFPFYIGFFANEKKLEIHLRKVVMQ